MTEQNPRPGIPDPPRRRIADVPVQNIRRTMIIASLFLLVLGLFLAMMRELLIAGIVGAIAGAYLRPFQNRLAPLMRWPGLSAVTIMAVVTAPVTVLLIYGYIEVREAAEYIISHSSTLADQIDTTLDRFPYIRRMDEMLPIESALRHMAGMATKLPIGVQTLLVKLSVNTSILLFTTFYVLTGAEHLVACLRERVPPQYAPLARRMEIHFEGVLYGAVYGALITQVLKALFILLANFLFGIPLPIVLALVTFVIGFFPVVGAWTIFVPAAGYLLVFQNSPWEALTMITLGFGFNTILLSMIIRPKLAAEQSQVLNFYWMFVALVSGVYTFGVAGILIGPIVVGLLKAVFDTITLEYDRLTAEDEDGPEPRIFREEKMPLEEEPEPSSP